MVLLAEIEPSGGRTSCDTRAETPRRAGTKARISAPSNSQSVNSLRSSPRLTNGATSHSDLSTPAGNRPSASPCCAVSDNPDGPIVGGLVDRTERPFVDGQTCMLRQSRGGSFAWRGCEPSALRARNVHEESRSPDLDTRRRPHSIPASARPPRRTPSGSSRITPPHGGDVGVDTGQHRLGFMHELLAFRCETQAARVAHDEIDRKDGLQLLQSHRQSRRGDSAPSRCAAGQRCMTGRCFFLSQFP